MKITEGNTLLRVGIIGALLTALCCFTPLLVILLGALGLAALTGYLDYVLLPALAMFVILIIYAARRRTCNLPNAKGISHE
ncbi:mercury resistance system transport protein MerF [Ferrigenium sp. UT4]